jgi:hypothetical protein
MNGARQMILLAGIRATISFMLILACTRLALFHHIKIKRAGLKVVVVGLHASAKRWP